MLSALPLELRILIAQFDEIAYWRFYQYYDDFAKYARTRYAIIDFTLRFTVSDSRPEYGGAIMYTLFGKLHRTDGPAMIKVNGENRWFINGHLYREGGLPVVESANGTQLWYYNNKYSPYPP